jgi:DNA adenine methylase
MVGYCGGKAKIGKEIANVMHEYTGLSTFDSYIEPFCGMCSVMRNVNAHKRYASDIFEEIIVLFQEMQKGHMPSPDDIPREAYYELKHGGHSLQRTFAGLAKSYGGCYYTCYAKDRKVGTTHKSLLHIIKDCADVTFTCTHYDELIPHNSVVYCDPPYETHRGKFGQFDHEAFWQTMREWSRDNKVFISETSAPPDFKCVWEKEVHLSVQSALRRTRREKLYVYSP